MCIRDSAKAIGRVPILGSAGEAHGLALVAERMSGRRHRIATVLVHRVPTHSGAQEDEL